MATSDTEVTEGNGDVCEGCDGHFVGRGFYTADDVYLCEPCYDALQEWGVQPSAQAGE